MTGLQDKVVIITGASSGIGAQTAVEFAKHGSKVVLTARRQEKLEETAKKCQEQGLDDKKILIVTGDIMNDKDLKRLVRLTLEKFEGINILVNNAGEATFGNLMTSSVDDMDKMYRMHVRAVFMLITNAVPYLLASKGTIVNVSSIASSRPLPYVLPYTVAKCAQDQLMRSLSLELGPKGVRVNSVCPGTIPTGIFTKSGYSDEEGRQKVIDDLASTHPLGRTGTPEEVAKSIVFLASDDASFISGVALPVDGARHNTSWMMQSQK